MNLKTDRIRFILMLCFITYMEIVFSMSTTKCLTVKSVVINIIFSLSYSLIILSVLHLLRNTKVFSVCYYFVLIFLPVIYYAEFLVNRSFQIFYDLNTVANGAGGALSEFMSDILRLIFCVDGITILLLFFAPLFVYIVIIVASKKKASKTDADCKESLEADSEAEKKNKGLIRNIISFATIIVVAIVLFVTADCLVYTDEIYANMYDREYNYQTVVENLGLMTGLRLDVKYLVFGNNEEVDFELELADDSPNDVEIVKVTQAAEEQTRQEEEIVEEEEIEETVIQGDNVLNIDFEALAQTTSGTNAKLDQYVAGLTPSNKNEYTGIFKGKNLIFITAEAFSGYVVDRKLTPTLYKLIHEGFYFEDFYQPAIAGTTGGEYNNIFGLLPTSGGKSMRKMTEGNTFTTMGNQLDKLGYFGKAYHNNSITVYSRDFTHNRLGYSEGFEGVGNGMEEYLSSSGFPASDLEMIQGSLPQYIDKQPFNIYYMTVSGHGQYGKSINRMSQKNWDRVANLPYSDKVKAYIANNLELEDALTYLVNELNKKGIAEDTVIVLSPDHFPYGLDQGAVPGDMPLLSELYGLNVENYLQRDRNSCIIWSGCMKNMKHVTISAPTFSLDLLPTLSNLFGVEFDSRLYPGRDVFSDAEAIVFDGGYDWKTELGTYIASKNKFTPVNDSVEIPEDYVKRISTIVKNKYSFCKGVLSDNYYGHVYSAWTGEAPVEVPAE